MIEEKTKVFRPIHYLGSKLRMLDFIEETITPFELQRADEIFITNMVRGVQSVTRYRKKSYETDTANELIDILNDSFFD